MRTILLFTVSVLFVACSAPDPTAEALREVFLDPLGMTQTDLAKRIHVSFPRKGPP